jgi:hypothetical protein
MPGAVGILRVDGRAASVSAALKKLLHFQTYYSKKIYCTERVALGIVDVWDRAPAFDWHFDLQSNTGVLLVGTMLGTNPNRHVLDAREVLAEYQSHGFTRWDQFDGGFLVVILDILQKRLFLANDRLGQLPLYYGSRPGVFAFAPEVKGVLVHEGFEARLSTAGIINFLSAGYCFGDLTLFDDVKALEPSTVLSVDLSTLALQKTRLWKMIYEPSPELEVRQVAEDELFESILEAHKTTLCDRPSRVAILLSAGLDSRGMLAALGAIGQLPQLAITWGLPQEVPNSDVSLARRIADSFGIPFMRVPYTSDTFVDNATRWCYLSELANDNFGWCAQGPEVLAPLDKEPFDVLLVGDEVWGRGGFVSNEMDARGAIFPARLPAVLKNILAQQFVEIAEEMYDEAIRGVSEPCENTEFVDRKDFMYIHGRVVRFLFPIRSQYKKEFALLLRRPFLSNSVIDVVRRLPSRFRLDRNLYISMLRRHFPRALDVPISSARSNPDWVFDFQRKEILRDYFGHLLDRERLAQTPLAQLLDWTGFQQLHHAFFGSKPHSLSQGNSWVTHWQAHMAFFASHFPNAVSHLPKAARLIRSVGRTAKSWSGSSSEEFQILRRFALLSLLQQQLGDFDRSHAEDRL